MSFTINDPTGEAIGSHHPRGANVSYADGSVKFLNSDVAPAIIERLSQKADGVAVPVDY
jgi:prepilin-type processing-associated H-X9-DG protein